MLGKMRRIEATLYARKKIKQILKKMKQKKQNKKNQFEHRKPKLVKRVFVNM